MKKTLLLTTLFIFTLSLVATSCSSKKKGVKCPAYSSTQKANLSKAA